MAAPRAATATRTWSGTTAGPSAPRRCRSTPALAGWLAARAFSGWGPGPTAGFTALGTSFNNSRHVGGAGFSPLRVALGAAIGGTASRITGGKFANGAVTGAFSQAFNNEVSEVGLEKRIDRVVAAVAEDYGDVLEAGRHGGRQHVPAQKHFGTSLLSTGP